MQESNNKEFKQGSVWLAVAQRLSYVDKDMLNVPQTWDTKGQGSACTIFNSLQHSFSKSYCFSFKNAFKNIRDTKLVTDLLLRNSSCTFPHFAIKTGHQFIFLYILEISTLRCFKQYPEHVYKLKEGQINWKTKTMDIRN